MQQTVPLTNDYILIGAMERLTGIKAGANTWDEYAEAYDERAPSQFPVGLGWVLPLYERIPVVASVLRPKKGMEVAKALSEVECLLCTNVAQQGKEALWFLKRVPSNELESEVTRWMSLMSEGKHEIVAKDHVAKGYAVLAAPVEVFT